MKTIPRLFVVFSMVAAITAPCVPAFAEEALGRLFFTPERRQALDRQRQFNIQEKQETPEDPTFTIVGVVMRSSGKQTVWVNGSIVGENGASSDMDVVPLRKSPGQVVIQAGESPTTSAKVGETVLRSTGETTDMLNGGHIAVRRPSPSR